MKRNVNPIDLELVKDSLGSLVDEMSLTIVRTAHSSVLRDVMDFSTAFCDTQGRIIMQGVTIPNQLGAMPDAVNAIKAKYSGSLVPGDIIIMNDPYEGGMHLPDIFVFKPVFVQDQLACIVATVAHHTEVGGRVPGSLATDSTEIYQEGLRIPPLKLFEAGKPNEAIFSLIERNVRVPDTVLGDLAAQLAACEVGERGYLKLVRKFGVDGLQEFFDDLLDYTERITRAEIAGWPDGTYEFTDYIDNDGVTDDPVPIHVKVDIRRDEVWVDFDGTSPQVPAAINATFSFTKSAVYFALRSLLTSNVPNNAGYFRPIHVSAPAATLVNAVLPAACAARGITGFRICNTLFGALAGALPERVPAADEGGVSLVSIGGYDLERKPYVLVEVLAGSWGGGAGRDGSEGMPNIGANISNAPVEMIEARFPIRIERYGFMPDTGGPGEFRGGLSLLREYRLLKGSASLLVRSDRRAILPYGLQGGHPGSPSNNLLITRNGVKVLPPKVNMTIHENDVFRHVLPGGGGYGDPLRRDPLLVMKDVHDQKISPEYAAREYGVVIHENSLALDLEATARLRRQMADRRPKTLSA
ncbi:MAG: hydantoinase B/oxoprolinase family protein [Acidobacteriota bacterium]